MDKFNQENNDKNKEDKKEYISPMINNQLNNDNFINNNYLYRTISNEKKYLNFSSEKNSIIKNLNLNQILELDTEEKKEINLVNDIVYNEIINNLNNIIYKLQIKDSRKNNFFYAKNNLYSNIKYFLNDIINIDEKKTNKLMIDLEDIKIKYDN